jgi:hypothetical protein
MIPARSRAICSSVPRYSQLLLWLYCFSFAFDYKGLEGGSIAHVVFSAVALISAALFTIDSTYRFPRLNARGAPLAPFAWWIIFIILTIPAFMHYGLALGDYLRVVLPFCLFGLSLLMIILVHACGLNLMTILRPLYFASCTSLVWTVIYTIFFQGIQLSEVRHQIVGQGFIIVVAYIFAKLVIHECISIFDFLMIIVAVGTVGASLTRTYLVIVASIIVAYVFVSRGLVLGQTRIRMIVYVFTFILILIVGLYLALGLRYGILESWYFRLFEARTFTSGADITTVTRLAEYSYQWHALTSEWFSMVFGRGIGSHYGYDPRYYAELSQVFSVDYLRNIDEFFAGHSLWVYSVYAGGFAGGLIPPVLLLLGLRANYRKARSAVIGRRRVPQRVLEQGGSEALVYMITFFALVAYLSASFTANPFGGRLAALTLGLLVGVAFTSARYGATPRRRPEAGGEGQPVEVGLEVDGPPSAGSDPVVKEAQSRGWMYDPRENGGAGQLEEGEAWTSRLVETWLQE